jgi:hypothetical protein
MITPCGKTVSVHGKPWTEASLKQHIKDCLDYRCVAQREPLQAPCGRTHTSHGKPFTPEGLQSHIRDCQKDQCRVAREQGLEKRWIPKKGPIGKGMATEENYDPLGLLDDDMPNGAYFAMHHEIYGW